MDKRIHMGMNRTGMKASPLDASDLVEGLALQEAVPQPDIGADEIRATYARDEDTVGSMPPPTNLKGMVGAIADSLSGQRLHVLLDKLGERAAYERTGARLYDAMLLKIAGATRLPGDMTVDAVQAIRDDEAAHLRMLGDAIEALGGDPTVQTPCADLAGVQGMGLVQAMNEPRATLSQALQTLLAAELIDVASWELLISLSEQLGHTAWTSRFADALASENEHLARVAGRLARSGRIDRALNLNHPRCTAHRAPHDEETSMPLPSLPSAARFLGCAFLFALAACDDPRSSSPLTKPPGEAERPRTNMLEAGAAMLQGNGPVAKLDIHLVGFHPMKDHPRHQMEAHHYCRQVNEDFAQCVLFDAEGEDANLTGVEYIISGRLFVELPPEERVYWHPHNGEILSGQLVAPGIPEHTERSLMRAKINSYGKTWHTWHTRNGLRPADSLPHGPAMLAWSFNREGEASPGLVEARDRRMGIDSAAIARKRQALVPLARPQEGVDALRSHFRGTTAIPGVVDLQAKPAREATRPPAP